MYIKWLDKGLRLDEPPLKILFAGSKYLISFLDKEPLQQLPHYLKKEIFYMADFAHVLGALRKHLHETGGIEGWNYYEPTPSFTHKFVK